MKILVAYREEKMKKSKQRLNSKVLGPGRPVHADVFKLGPSTDRVVLLFGGSGISEEEYAERSETIIPVFDKLLQRLPESNTTFLHATAPYDVPFARFENEPAQAEVWNQHVVSELLQPWKDLPYWACGYSGGAALALNGIHDRKYCVGGAVFGADQVPPDFTCPAQWARPLLMYRGKFDPVCHDPRNRDVASRLNDQGQAEVIDLSAGHHRLADYACHDGVGHLLTLAAAM
ncbi:hypothetical protein HG15A2_04540 [Adhaeretor mobilis]|uniref:Serine hydrolase FSH domain-containing protein n=2 Tax=Adhaeretor mobilis TaxID=1930276 RepID=A0A517MQP5_9BACT|nr:hypothetical protein HG15A2_04540 [Adhaeretor mobilis]